MSSTVSCSSAAHRVSVSRRSPAQIFATSTGWVMKSSPDLRRWSAWRSQANAKARSIASRSIAGVAVGRVLADDREQVAEQRPLVRGQALGDLVHRGRGPVRVVGADLDVAASTGAAAPLPSASSVFARSGIADPPRSTSDRRRTPRSAQDPSPTRIRPPGCDWDANRSMPRARARQDPRPAGGRLGRARVGTLAAAQQRPRCLAADAPASGRDRVHGRAPRARIATATRRRVRAARTRPRRDRRRGAASRLRRPRAPRGGRTAADRSTTRCSKRPASPGSRASAAQSASTTPAPATATRASAAAISASARRAETRPSSPPPKRAGRTALSTSSRRRIASAHRASTGTPLDASAAIVAVADAPRRSTRSRAPAGRANCGGQARARRSARRRGGARTRRRRSRRPTARPRPPPSRSSPSGRASRARRGARPPRSTR